MLIQDVTQGNREGGSVTLPDTIIIDDRTGKEDSVSLNSSIARALDAAGLPTTTPRCGDKGEPGDNTAPGTAKPYTDQQKYFTDVTTRAILPDFKQAGRPFAMVCWSRDPDGN